jgi:hypothetical protein
MAAAFHSSDLQWQLLRANHSFLVKRGPTAVFSAEPLNLTNTHSYKFSGLGQRTQWNTDRTIQGHQVGAVCSCVSLLCVCRLLPRPPALSAAAAALCSRLLLRPAACCCSNYYCDCYFVLLQLTLALSV